MQLLRRPTGDEPLRLRLAGRRVVTIGSGTGPFALLSHLKRYPCSITAIVSMADSGGSSRRLMDEYGHLPVGDLCQALVALSRTGALWRDLFAYRFREQRPADRFDQSTGHGGVGGHSLGNLILCALQRLGGDDLLAALASAQALLDTAGAVLPITLDRATLCVELEDGELIWGECEIDTRGRRAHGPLTPIRRVLLAERAAACDQALLAIRQADLIVLGPGDLYTSILPNLLVDGVAEAIRTSPARTVYVCNLMTKRGETDGYRASDFVRQVQRYLGAPVDRVVLHDGTFPDGVRETYAAQHQYPVRPDVELVRRMVPEVVVDDLLAVEGAHLVRHDAARLLDAITLTDAADPSAAYALVGGEVPARLLA